MKTTFNNATIDLTPQGKSYRAVIGDEAFDVEVVRVDAEHGRLDLKLTNASVALRGSVTKPGDEAVSVSAYVSTDGTKRWVTINGRTFLLIRSTGGQRKGSSHEAGSGLVAPMPGLVRSVNVVEGEAVVKGQTLLVLEAMKMEIRIQAKSDGVVKRLLVRQGQTVEREQVLIEIEGTPAG
jgi:biotin carboxyl carrier protein